MLWPHRFGDRPLHAICQRIPYRNQKVPAAEVGWHWHQSAQVRQSVPRQEPFEPGPHPARNFEFRTLPWQDVRPTGPKEAGSRSCKRGSGGEDKHMICYWHVVIAHLAMHNMALWLLPL